MLIGYRCLWKYLKVAGIQLSKFEPTNPGRYWPAEANSGVALTIAGSVTIGFDMTLFTLLLFNILGKFLFKI